MILSGLFLSYAPPLRSRRCHLPPNRSALYLVSPDNSFSICSSSPFPNRKHLPLRRLCPASIVTFPREQQLFETPNHHRQTEASYSTALRGSSPFSVEC